MKKKIGNIKAELLQHSQAKVSLYGEYLSVYLSILSRTKYVDNILLFDLLCGEGLYQDNLKGSPLVALDALKRNSASNVGGSINVSVTFNDNGMSEIIEGVKKVDRLESIVKKEFIPSNVTIHYHDKEFEEVLFDSINKVSSTNKAKALFFIDPYGYKNIHPKHIKQVLSLKNTEVLLFLPASHMYRFANKCTHSNFCGSDPLSEFLTDLFCGSTPQFNSVKDFVDKCRYQFKAYLDEENIFVDSFTLERDKVNTYCLFFFTSNILGFEKMLEAKWKIDTENGKGFTISPQQSLFSGVQHSEYPQKLLKFIQNNESVTNKQVYLFGLENGYLPKHSNEVLKSMTQGANKLEVISLDGEPAKGFYISYKHYNDPSARKVSFRIGS
ncbi:MAG: three-Cys-motif partner protein TcmP [Proteobacteria bacterium]|nr:three-Cys-motif partner protein TcmP [Pseudomonadota bacterium]